jgi:hypothetical protein
MNDTDEIELKKQKNYEQRLINLSKARTAGLAKKKQLNELKNKENLVKKQELQERLSIANRKLSNKAIQISNETNSDFEEETPIKNKKIQILSSSESEEDPQIKTKKKKKKKKIPQSSSSDSSSEDEPPIKIKKKSKKKKIPQSSSSESSDNESKFKISDEYTKNKLYQKIQEENYKNNFNQMFPNYNLV